MQSSFTGLLLLILLVIPSVECRLFFNLDNGELCLQNHQCKSNCCHREDGLRIVLCDPNVSKVEKCYSLNQNGMYYFCPCKSGLSCKENKTILGNHDNKDYGYCRNLREKDK